MRTTLTSLFLSLFLFYSCSRSTDAGVRTLNSDSQRVTITYIANEGVLLSSGDKQVLIDGLHREYKPDYSFPPKTLLNALETAQPPYNEIDLVLVSHLHLDHFHPESIGLHLKNNPRALLVSSDQIADGVKKDYAGSAAVEKQVRRVTPEWKTKTPFTASGINLQVLGLKHGGAHFSWIQNLGYLIEINGKKFLHIGDADMTAENFSSFRLNEERIDVAFIPYWYLLSESGRSLVREQFNPKQVIAVHVPPAEAESLAEKFSKEFPGTITFKKILESRSF
jgi:L-ascorbate metabolism protein UlaG (beta-lactamase superfamily)